MRIISMILMCRNSHTKSSTISLRKFQRSQTLLSSSPFTTNSFWKDSDSSTKDKSQNSHWNCSDLSLEKSINQLRETNQSTTLSLANSFLSAIKSLLSSSLETMQLSMTSSTKTMAKAETVTKFKKSN